MINPDMPDAELRLHMGELTANELRVARAAIRWAQGDALEAAARIAEWAHMVPPDGGSPTAEEEAVANHVAERIRALKTTDDKRAKALDDLMAEDSDLL
jgi:hypothetical protein